MLFKYLIGTIALAACVVSSPTGESQFAGVQKVNYNKCLTTIVEVKQPVITSCTAGKVDDVKGHLEEVHKPVEDISTSFKSSVTVEKTVVVEQSKQFIEVLKKFEAILVVIQSHPKVLAGCTDVFTKFNYSFESISTEFKSHGVDIYKSIKESSLQISVWTSLGFKFYDH